MLRGIARYAGVHLYDDQGDVLFASNQLFGAHTVSGGRRTFALRQPVEIVYDLFAKQTVAENTATFDVTLPPKSTTLYYPGDKAALGALR